MEKKLKEKLTLGCLFEGILIYLILVIDYITYAYNAFLSILFRLFFGLKPLQTHTPSSTYHPAVLVTGCSSGIGKETALSLAKKGYTVFATVRKNDDAKNLKMVFEGFNNPNEGRLIPIIMDVTRKIDIQKAYNQVKEIIGEEIPFVGLVNNAGLVAYLPVEVANDACFEDTFETNFTGLVNVTKKFMPLLRESRGRVVNIGSVATWGGIPSMGIYAASKAAVNAITRVWRMESRPFGVHFSLIEPGAISTRMTEQQLDTWANLTSFESTYKSKYYDPKHGIASNVLVAYENTYKRIGKVSKSVLFKAIPPTIVADAVINALSSSYPKNTYYIGLDARVMAALSWLIGDKIIESVTVKALTSE